MACRQFFTEGVDWGALIKTASEKGILSIVYQRLKPYLTPEAAVNNGIRQMQLIQLVNSAKNYHYKEELLKIMRYFWENNLAIIPLKGLNLSQRLYQDITSRDMSADIDMLVKENDKERARSLLEDLGYNFLLVEEAEAYQWYYLFNKPGFKPIELHWDITMMARDRLRIDGFWQGTYVAEWEGVKFYDFYPEELLLYSAVHIVNSDSFRQLRYICDIKTLFDKYGDKINWSSLARKAKKWRLGGPAYAMLAVSKDFFSPNFPSSLSFELGVSSLKRLFIRAFANRGTYFSRGLKRRLLDAYLSYIFFELCVAVSLRDYLAILKRVFVPCGKSFGPKDYILRPLKGLFHFIQDNPGKKQKCCF